MTLRRLLLGLIAACLALPAPVAAQQNYQPAQPAYQPAPPPAPPQGEQPPDQSWVQPQNPPPTPPPQPPAPPAPPPAEETAPEESGFLLRARIASSYPLGYAPHAGPDVVIGTVLGSLQLHAGLAITTLGTSEESTYDDGEDFTSETTIFALVLSPGFSYTMFRSTDGKAHAYLGLSALVGTLNASGDDVGDDESAILYGGYVAFGGEYRVHSAFGTGLEAGYGAIFGSDSEGDSNLTVSMTGFFAAIVATLYLGG